MARYTKKVSFWRPPSLPSPLFRESFISYIASGSQHKKERTGYHMKRETFFVSLSINNLSLRLWDRLITRYSEININKILLHCYDFQQSSRNRRLFDLIGQDLSGAIQFPSPVGWRKTRISARTLPWRPITRLAIHFNKTDNLNLKMKLQISAI